MDHAYSPSFPLSMVNVDSLQLQMQEERQVLNEGGQAVKGVYGVMKEVRPACDAREVESLCDRIDSERDQFKLSTLKAKRYMVLSKILRNDRDLYKQACCSAARSLARTARLQDIPIRTPTSPTTSQLRTRRSSVPEESDGGGIGRSAAWPTSPSLTHL